MPFQTLAAIAGFKLQSHLGFLVTLVAFAISSHSRNAHLFLRFKMGQQSPKVPK